MATTDKKQKLCEEHEKMLKIIYHLGKGIMFRKHVERYMELRGTHTIRTSVVITMPIAPMALSLGYIGASDALLPFVTLIRS